LPLLEPDGRIGVIDWARSRIGDPAYDLAIVTRGVRRPFQVENGLARLLDAYRAAGGQSVTAAQVHLHELCLAMRWYRDSLDPARRVHPAEQELNRLRGIFKRATAGAGRG
jgi:aminoglycoside phosphotransferase (APT) family kinase protein